MALSALSCESASAILPSPLGGDGYVSSRLQVQVSKEQAGFGAQSYDQTFAKKHCCAHCHFWDVNMCDWFPSLLRQILLQFFQLCALIQLDSQAGQEQAIPILERQTSLQEGNGSGNLIHWMALLLPGSDIPPRSWLPLVVKYPIAVVIGTNGINHILQPNLDMNISPPGSSWKFFSLWKDFLCLKHHTFNLVPLNTGCV